MNEKLDGFSLLNEVKNLQFPSGCAGEEIEGIELVLLDADVVGCADQFYGRFGNLRKPKIEIKNALLSCKKDLEAVLPKLPNNSKAYFNRLLILCNVVLRDFQESVQTTIEANK